MTLLRRGVEAASMGPAAKREYMKAIYDRYHRARKKAKKAILDEFEKVYKCHRKSAIRLLNGPPPTEEPPRREGGGNTVYGDRIISILENFWGAAGCLWSRRLQAAMPLWLPSIRKRFSTTPEEERQLLSMSPSTMDRRLKDKKDQARKRLYGTTKPGKWLRSQIPVVIEHWDVRKPGYTALDLVSHSGPCSAGLFGQTVNQTDIFSCWVSRRAILGKFEELVSAAMDDMQAELPFQVLGAHVDNGSEFINAHLVRHCQDRRIQLTRGRPRKKNDNAHVEQKNGTHVRQPMGYLRYDTQVVVDAMNALYRDGLDPFQNLFQPSVKLVKTIRRGSRLQRFFDKPTTPLDRLIRSKRGIRERVRVLKKLRDGIDPFELSRVIDAKLERIYAMSSEFRKLAVPGTMAASRKINTAFVVGKPELGEHWAGPFVNSPVARYARAHYRDGLFQTRS